MNYKIFCDADGVIVDFHNGYKQYTGVDCVGVLGEDGNWVNGPGFWERIDFIDFWENLPWMSDGKQLWDYIKNHELAILSAPSKSKTSKEGKIRWVGKHLPGTTLHLAYRENKMKFARPGAILIDDLEKTIIEWREAGGIGILHTSAENTINELKKLGI